VNGDAGLGDVKVVLLGAFGRVRACDPAGPSSHPTRGRPDRVPVGCASMTKNARIEAVERATGRSWDEWLDYMSGIGAEGRFVSRT
jgi:hypothetical protein